jgi:hypothetical protein
MIGNKRNAEFPPAEGKPWDDAPPEYDDNLTEDGEKEEMIKDVAPAPAPVVSPATQSRLGVQSASKGIFDEIDTELFAAVPTVEDRRLRDIYWAVYRLMRRDVRGRWYSQTKNITEMPAELPAYSSFSNQGELIFDSEEFRNKFEEKFGRIDSPKYSADDFLALAKRFWKEGASETILLNWLRQDYQNYRNAQTAKSPSFEQFKHSFGGHEVDGLF